MEIFWKGLAGQINIDWPKAIYFNSLPFHNETFE